MSLSDGVDESSDVTVIESVCMNCYNNGTTRILNVRIPFFRDVILVSFECRSCGYKNNELQSGEPRKDYGEKIIINVTNKEDLNRQLIKTENASVHVNEIDFEIPAQTQKGVITTIEGVIRTAHDNLRKYHAERISQTPDIAHQLEPILAALQKMYQGNYGTFSLTVDDPSGNSYVQSLSPPNDDSSMQRIRYRPTEQQLHNMGFYELQNDDDDLQQNTPMKEACDLEMNMAEEAVKFDTVCSQCGKMGQNAMCEIDIPGFKKCLIMSFSCPFCGFKNSEVKPSGAIGEYGREWTLDVRTREDLDRDVLKSEFCSVKIPDIDFEILPSTLGSFITTVEGLLMKVASNLEESYPFTGDSADNQTKEISLYKHTIESLKELCSNEAKMPFTIIFDDPADHSLIGPRVAASREYKDRTVNERLSSVSLLNSDDLILKYKTYKRTKEQDDDLGLLDMKVEDYE